MATKEEQSIIKSKNTDIIGWSLDANNIESVVYDLYSFTPENAIRIKSVSLTELYRIDYN